MTHRCVCHVLRVSLRDVAFVPRTMTCLLWWNDMIVAAIYLISSCYSLSSSSFLQSPYRCSLIILRVLLLPPPETYHVSIYPSGYCIHPTFTGPLKLTVFSICSHSDDWSVRSWNRNLVRNWRQLCGEECWKVLILGPPAGKTTGIYIQVNT